MSYIVDVISDFAALAVARALGHAKNGCGMHGDDKIGRWLAGLLKKLDGTGTDTAVDPFPEAEELIDLLREEAKWYSHGTRLKELHVLCQQVKCACICFQIDLSHTRIRSVQNLLLSSLRMAPG